LGDSGEAGPRSADVTGERTGDTAVFVTLVSIVKPLEPGRVFPGSSTIRRSRSVENRTFRC
jgi:hypothetical protein